MDALLGVGKHEVVLHQLNSTGQVAAYRGVDVGVVHGQQGSPGSHVGGTEFCAANAVFLKDNQQRLLQSEAGDGFLGGTRKVVLLHGEVAGIHSHVVAVPEVRVGLRLAPAHDNAQLLCAAESDGVRAVHDAVVGVGVFFGVGNLHRVHTHRVVVLGLSGEGNRAGLEVHGVPGSEDLLVDNNLVDAVDVLHGEVVHLLPLHGAEPYNLLPAQAVLGLVLVTGAGGRFGVNQDNGRVCLHRPSREPVLCSVDAEVPAFVFVEQRPVIYEPAAAVLGDAVHHLGVGESFVGSGRAVTEKYAIQRIPDVEEPVPPEQAAMCGPAGSGGRSGNTCLPVSAAQRTVFPDKVFHCGALVGVDAVVQLPVVEPAVQSGEVHDMFLGGARQLTQTYLHLTPPYMSLKSQPAPP